MLSRAEEYTELGQAVGDHCGYSGAAEGMRLGRGQKMPHSFPVALRIVPQARPDTPSPSYLTPPWHTGDGLVSSSGAMGPGCGAGRVPGNCPAPHSHLQMAKWRPRGGKGISPSNPSQAILLSTAAGLGSLPPPLGRGSDFSKIM